MRDARNTLPSRIDKALYEELVSIIHEFEMKDGIKISLRESSKILAHRLRNGVKK